MKANELRIGNLVSFIGNDGLTYVQPVVGISNDGVSVIRHEYFLFNEDLIPVVISEEILLKCGFEVNPFSLGLTLDRFRFILKTEYKYWYVVDAYSNSYLTKIEFVHELQNFIFVMNGQELNTSGL